MRVSTALALTALVACLALPAAAQQESCALPAAAISVAQVARGTTAYVENCAQCHGDKLEGTFAPPLNDEAFRAKWSAMSVSDLTNFTSTLMPPGKPGTLPMGHYYDVAAFIISANGGITGDSDLDDKSPALKQCVTSK
jgi:mono/diheme cytochrome c family protein